MRTKRFGLYLLVLGSLVMTGCHHRQTPPATATDSVQDTVQIKASEKPEYSEPEQKTPQLYRLQGDTATRVDFAAFRRRQTVFYTAEQIAGEWVQGTLHEVYRADGTGLSWDTEDDVGREEGKQFRWTLDSNQLRVVYPIATGGVVPRDYFVTFADDESLVYKDGFGTSYMWDKIPKE